MEQVLVLELEKEKLRLEGLIHNAKSLLSNIDVLLKAYEESPPESLNNLPKQGTIKLSAKELTFSKDGLADIALDIIDNEDRLIQASEISKIIAEKRNRECTSQFRQQISTILSKLRTEGKINKHQVSASKKDTYWGKLELFDNDKLKAN